MANYRNPLRGATVTFGRVDQGVDYDGSGPLYALGPGVVEEVYNSGWPGGTFIDERLTGGPAAGAYWYTAEDITPNVRVGEQVDSGTVIGWLHGGMETGWAAPPPNTGESLAHLQGHYTFPTPEGQQALTLLRSTGAPGPGTKSAGGKLQIPIGPFHLGVPNPFSGVGNEFKTLGITVPIVLGGAALVVLGLWKASHAGQKIQTAQQDATGIAGNAAGAAAGAAL